jgi:putative flippase GtrA
MIAIRASFREGSKDARGRAPPTPLHTLGRFLRFLLVGLKSNVVYYILYVAFTAAGMGIKLSATLVFLFGIVYSFLFNRTFVFFDAGRPGQTFLRYALVYVAAWAVNMLCLELFVAHWHYSHHIVQAVLVAVIGSGIFFALKLFVFCDPMDELPDAPHTKRAEAVTASEQGAFAMPAQDATALPPRPGRNSPAHETWERPGAAG